MRLDERGLPVDAGPDRAQVARSDPVPREPRAERDDRRRRSPVAGLLGLEDAVVAELAHESRIRAGALAELLERKHRDVQPRSDSGLRSAAAVSLAPAGHRQLLPDDAQRQELVPLKPEDRAQSLDVVLGEEPVPAVRPAEHEQTLILEVPDLRDRDVRELLFQLPADGADREGRPARSETAFAAMSSALQEGELVLADLHLVTVFEPLGSRPGGG